MAASLTSIGKFLPQQVNPAGAAAAASAGNIPRPFWPAGRDASGKLLLASRPHAVASREASFAEEKKAAVGSQLARAGVFAAAAAAPQARRDFLVCFDFDNVLTVVNDTAPSEKAMKLFFSLLNRQDCHVAIVSMNPGGKKHIRNWLQEYLRSAKKVQFVAAANITEDMIDAVPIIICLDQDGNCRKDYKNFYIAKAQKQYPSKQTIFYDDNYTNVSQASSMPNVIALQVPTGKAATAFFAFEQTYWESLGLDPNHPKRVRKYDFHTRGVAFASFLQQNGAIAGTIELKTFHEYSDFLIDILPIQRNDIISDWSPIGLSTERADYMCCLKSNDLTSEYAARLNGMYRKRFYQEPEGFKGPEISEMKWDHLYGVVMEFPKDEDGLGQRLHKELLEVVIDHHIGFGSETFEDELSGKTIVRFNFYNFKSEEAAKDFIWEQIDDRLTSIYGGYKIFSARNNCINDCILVIHIPNNKLCATASELLQQIMANFDRKRAPQEDDTALTRAASLFADEQPQAAAGAANRPA